MSIQPKPTDQGSCKSARLFRNGANQAVRIPREFELPGEHVTIRQVGSSLIIEPKSPEFPRGSVRAVLAALSALTTTDDVFPDVDEGLLPLDDVKL